MDNTPGAKWRGQHCSWQLHPIVFNACSHGTVRAVARICMLNIWTPVVSGRSPTRDLQFDIYNILGGGFVPIAITPPKSNAKKIRSCRGGQQVGHLPMVMMTRRRCVHILGCMSLTCVLWVMWYPAFFAVANMTSRFPAVLTDRVAFASEAFSTA